MADTVFDFETSLQFWTSNSPGILSVGIVTTRAFSGTRSLAVQLKAAAALNASRVSTAVDLDLAGGTASFHCWFPSKMPISALRPFAKDDAGNMYGPSLSGTAIAYGSWLAPTLTIPATAGRIKEVGFEIDVSAAWSGTFYIDRVVLSPAVVIVPPPPPPDPLPPPPSGAYALPADRVVTWNPGLNAVGGIPARTTIYKTLSPNGTNDTSQIQSALDTCPAGQVVQLNPGTFKVSGEGLSITRDNVVLRGSGLSTLITRIDTTDYPVAIIGQRWMSDKFWSATNLAADATKGSKSVTLTSMPSVAFQVGEIVYLDQLTDTSLTVWSPERSPAGDPSRGWFSRMDRPGPQILEIAAISGSTLTFTTELHLTYRTALSAQLCRYGETWRPAPVAAVKWSGIEDLTIENGRGGDGGGNLHFFVAAYCWAKNIESRMSRGTSVNLDGAFRCEVRDSYIHTSANPNPGGEGYLLGLNYGAADNLVENCVIWNGNKVVVMRSTGGGNVLGYNYLQDAYGAGFPNWVETGLNATHMTTAHFELFEGNESFSLGSDDTWGNSVYITSFRNSFTGLRTNKVAGINLQDLGDRAAVKLTRFTRMYNCVGNVLGFPNMPLLSGQTSFVAEKTAAFNDESIIPMWKLGYTSSDETQPADPQVAATLLRVGNYDYVSKVTSTQTLANSLYLTQKPAFFGALAWPWVDTTATTDAARVQILPAKARFNLLHP